LDGAQTVHFNQSGELWLVINDEETRGPRPPQGFVTTYYPNVRDAASSAPFQVSPGEELSHVVIRLLPEVLYTVRIKLPDPPASGITPRFALRSRGGTGGNMNTSFGFNGTVEFRSVLPGSYELTGTMRSTGDSETPQSYSRQPVEVVDRDVEVEAAPFTPLFDVTGSVQVDAAPPFPLQQVRLTLRKDSVDHLIPGPNVVMAADGTFAAHGVIADTYSLSASMPPGAYLKSVKLGNRELPDLHVDFSDGAARLTILLATDGGRIRGAVENAVGGPAVRIPVTLYPEGKQRDRQDRIRTVRADTNGKYEFRDLAPGDYRMYAWDDSDVAASRDPEFRRTYEDQSVTVTVTAGASLAVALKTVAVARTISLNLSASFPARYSW